MSAPPECHYDVLGVQSNVSTEALKAAYRKRALLHHPDRNAGCAVSEEKFKAVQAAYDTLSCPVQRATYDRLKAGGFPSRSDAYADAARASGFRWPGDGPDPFADFRHRGKTAEQQAWEKRYESYKAGAVDWEWEKAEARVARERHVRNKTRASQADSKRVARVLRTQWMTSTRFTRQDGLLLSAIGMAGWGLSYILQ